MAEAQRKLAATEAKDAEVAPVRDALNRRVSKNHLAPWIQAAFEIQSRGKQ